jgi:hypothetical protein
MRQAARIFGMVWLAAIAVAGVILLASGRFPNVRVLMYALLGAALPGVFILHWSRTRPKRAAPNPLAPKAPFDNALEAGHVMRIDPGT